MDNLRWYHRLALSLSSWLDRLATVTAVDVGRPDDGVFSPVFQSGTDLDKPWHELLDEFNDAREAWSKNPLARRITGMITAYVVGNGIEIRSEYDALQRYITGFFAENMLMQEMDEWCDELSRSGELFVTLHTDRASGMSHVRLIPACSIERIEWLPGDYKTELRYKEITKMGDDERWWYSQHHRRTDDLDTPMMLHFAVNRPVGAVRGESDLAPILPWLRRYTRWLEDRVRLNAGTRAFLWIVYAARNAKTAIQEKYRTPPSPGSVVVAEEGSERWESISPNLNARDAEADGRAIRWMIISGGPGTSLLDIGEGEDANQATGKVMTEQRRRFLRRRQSYFSHVLSEVVLWGYRRQAGLGHKSAGRRNVSHADLQVIVPDISPEDNDTLANAASSLSSSLAAMRGITGDSESFRRMALRMFVKFSGEQISESEFESIIDEGKGSVSDGGENDE